MKKLIFFVTCFPSVSMGAWTSIGSVGLFTQNSSTAAWTVTISSTIEVGNVIICANASDNDGNGINTDDYTTMTDSAGNTWVSGGENERDPGAANAGAAVSIFYSLVTVQLSTGGTITRNTGAARSAKGMSCWEFSVSTGSVVIISTGTEQTEDVSTDAAALTVGSIGNREHLWVRAIASETGTCDIATLTASFTKIPAACFNTGTEASSMGAVAEFRITTATTLTSDPTMSDTTADRASTMIALNEDSVISSGKRIMVVQ